MALMVIHTRSFACSTSVPASLFSRTCSSLNVGLSGFNPLPGVPGTRIALFSGDLGLIGMVADSRLLLLMYPNPISAGCDSGNTFCSPRGSTGEWMLVASANRGVLGGLPSDDVVEVESDEAFRTGSRLRAAGRFLSSFKPMATRVYDGDQYGKKKITNVGLKMTEIKNRQMPYICRRATG